MARARHEAPITEVAVRAFRVPTDAPEADGTLAWDSTTMVLVGLAAGGKTGYGYTYTYASAATGAFISESGSRTPSYCPRTVTATVRWSPHDASCASSSRQVTP